MEKGLEEKELDIVENIQTDCRYPTITAPLKVLSLEFL